MRIEKLFTAVRSKNLSLCLVLVAVGTFAGAQPSKEYLQKAMAAYGPWGDVKNFHYVAERTNITPWQSYSFINPKPAPNTSEVHIDFSTGTFRNNTVFTYPGGYVFDFVNIGKDSTRWLYDKNHSRNGKIMVKQGKESYTANMNVALQNIPYYILKTLAESTDSTSSGLSQNAQIIISRFLKNGSRTDYFFDAKTSLLQKVERSLTGKIFQTLFENYTSYNGLQMASSIKQMTDGVLTGTELLTTFRPNTQIAPALFVIPESYKLQQAAAPQPLQAKAIAKDVYLIEGVAGDRNVVFVNMNDYIIVTEAPLSSDITKAVLDVIHKQLPGKPVKYVHLSHHHNDHTLGIRQMVAEGATIICTQPVEAPMRAILNGALGTPADDYSKNPTQPQFELVTGVKILEDKDHRVEFHTVKNSHADGLSFMYLPKEGIIYEGDLLSIPEDGTITPAIEVNKEFNRYLKQNKVGYKRMIGHHGYSFITPEMFGKMLSLK